MAATMNSVKSMKPELSASTALNMTSTSLSDMISVKAGVAAFVVSTFRSRSKVHAKVVHTTVGGEVTEVGQLVVKEDSRSPLLGSKVDCGQLSFAGEVLGGN